MSPSIKQNSRKYRRTTPCRGGILCSSAEEVVVLTGNKPGGGENNSCGGHQQDEPFSAGLTFLPPRIHFLTVKNKITSDYVAE